MTERLDLSGFSPRLDRSPGTGEARLLERSVEATGGNLWATNPEEDYKADHIGELPDLCRALRQQTGITAGKCNSVALIDWTSLRHAQALLDPEGRRLPDPFTALADFGAVIAAVLFHDRIVVIPDATDANSDLGLDDVIRPIPIDLPGAPENRMRELLEAHYRWAIAELDWAATSEPQPAWMTELEDTWRNLLPGILIPTHALEAGYEQLLGYNASPDRQCYLSVTFQEDPARWVPSNLLPEAILDNDIRALFYERLSATLQAAFRDGTFMPEVRYIGGCLRSPMLLARAKAEEASLLPGATPENWLQKTWRDLYHAKGRTVLAPFWLQAVLASSRNREDIPAVLGSLRRSGSSYRRHRAELAEAVIIGDERELSKLVEALAGDLASLTKNASEATGAALDLATATLKVAAPVVPTELIKAGARAAGGQTGWLSKLGIRLFRPRLWFLINLAAKADRGRETIRHAARLFGFAGKDATEPVEFLTHLGHTTWIA